MTSRASARLPRTVIGATVLLAGAGLLTVPAAAVVGSSAPSPSTTRLSGFATATGAVRVGGVLWDDATVVPGGARTVTVQYRRQGNGRYATASAFRSTESGAVHLRLQPPSAGTWQFRVVVPSTSRTTGLVSKARTVRASGTAARTQLTGFTTAKATVALGDVVRDDVTVAPGGARTVLVQGRAPGTGRFATLSTGSTNRSGTFRAQFRPTTAGTWAFRLAVPATASARSLTSAARTITAEAPTAGQSTGGSAAPSAGGPTGGATSGGTTTGGSTPGGGGTTNPGGGTPQPVTTTADLAVRVPGYPNRAPLTKVTAGQQVAFDASASVAADGGTLVSGQIDYGDGQSDSFTNPNGPVDYWNTLHVYTGTGSRTVKLSVVDEHGTTDTTEVTIEVFDAPTASLRVTSGAARVGQPVTLAIDAATPAGTSLSSYLLVVDGALPGAHYFLGADQAPPATRDLDLTSPGTYTVTMHVENDAAGSPVEAPSVTFQVAP